MLPVSLFAVEEYEALQENLDLEKELRAEAEIFAREVSSLEAPIIGLAALDGYFCQLDMSPSHWAQTSIQLLFHV
jgi:hypothetical protein